MASSFNVFKINGNILTVNGVDYALDVVETGLASTSNSSFGTIKAIDNGDDTITLTINDKMLIVNKHVDYDSILMTFNDEILVEDGGLALEVSEEVSLISFTIEEQFMVNQTTTTTYQAESGMTWEEWVASAYNTAGLVADGYSVQNSDYSKTLHNTDSNNYLTYVSPSDTIINNNQYYLIAGGGSND